MTDLELLEAVLPPQRWAVQDLVPEGVTVFAGKAKSGKSWWLLQLARAVKRGELAFGRYPTEMGDVLYLALEDNDERMQGRLRMQLVGEKVVAGKTSMFIETRWPKANEGGIVRLNQWMDKHPNTRLIVIDVMRKFDPIGYSYGRDSAKIDMLNDFAEKRHVAVVISMHMYKGPGISASSADWMDKIQGSTGVVGAAQAIIGLSRDRGSDIGLLRVTGKDVPEADLPMRFDAERGLWRIDMEADEEVVWVNEMTQKRRAIIAVVERYPGVTAKEAANIMDPGNYPAIRHLMWLMVVKGQLLKPFRDGRHFTPEQVGDVVQGTFRELDGFPA